MKLPRVSNWKATLGVSLLASVVCVALFGTAVYAADSFVGTWKLNLSKSKYDPPNLAPKSQTTKIEAIENGEKLVTDQVDAQGKSIHYEFTAKFDGKDYPVMGDPSRDTIAIKKIDDYTYDSTNKKGGKGTTTNHTVYARDGKSRTITVTGTDSQGRKVNNIQVFDKQ